MGLFSRKPIGVLVAEANAEGQNTLKRTLGAARLIMLGIGVIIGAGLFSVTGNAAADFAGPAITISFVIAALGCCFAGLCYAEFASMLPVAGSAYTYSYATMGEFIAWIIGWDLVLEYAVAAATVSISWSRYLVILLEDIGIHIPEALTLCPWDGGIVNLPASLIVIISSLLLIRGTEKSSFVNMIIVILKISVVIIFIIIGWRYINIENYTPFIPQNTGTFGEYGISGIIRGAAIVFFAFIGFDAVSTAAQETINPKRNMPIGILGSLFACTVLYVLFAFVMLGVTNYLDFKGQDGIAPVAVAISHMGEVDANGVFRPAYDWLNKGVTLAILAGYSSVILVMLLGQSRVFYSMSKDKLLPPIFSEIHKKFQTPYKSNLMFMVVISILATLVPARVAGEMTSIGTLLAFIIVCFGVLVMRRTMSDVPRSFKTPFVPFVPVAGILICFFLMVFLPFDTWIRLIVWMIIGIDIYILYGRKRSRFARPTNGDNGNLTLSGSVIILSLILIIMSVWHQYAIGWDQDKILALSSITLGILHILLFGYKFLQDRYKIKNDR